MSIITIKWCTCTEAAAPLIFLYETLSIVSMEIYFGWFQYQTRKCTTKIKVEAKFDTCDTSVKESLDF